MIPETETSQFAPRLDNCLWVIVRDTKKAYVQENHRTKRSSCSKGKPRRKLAENLENVQIFPYACFVWLPWTIGLFLHWRSPPAPPPLKKKKYIYSNLSTSRSSYVGSLFKNEDRNPPSPQKDGS